MHPPHSLSSGHSAGAGDVRELLETRGSYFRTQHLGAGIPALANDDSRRRLHAEHPDDENDRGDDGLYEGEPRWHGAARVVAGARD
jgi:hypothetical protein